jgi:ketosteroid isomerase-like protein
MSQENIEVVERVIAAVSERDIERYLACCGENVRLETPWTAVEGAYEGADDIRRFFADLHDTAPDFRLTIERLEPIGRDRVLAFLRAHATGRASGIAAGAETLAAGLPETGIPTANVYDLADGEITRIRVFVDRQEALEATSRPPPPAPRS